MSDILEQMPPHFAAGTTVKLRRSHADYPASDWDLTLHLRGASILDVDATPDGDDFLVTIPAADSDGLTPGTYRWAERVSDGTEVYTAATGVVEITLDMATATAGAAQSHAERTLALIEAALEGRIPEGMESYQVAGRAVTKIPIAELAKLRGIYAAKVWREKNPGKMLPPVQLVFARA